MDKEVKETLLQKLKDVQRQERLAMYKRRDRMLTGEELDTLNYIIGHLQNSMKRKYHDESRLTKDFISQLRIEAVKNSLNTNKKYRDQCLDELSTVSKLDALFNLFGTESSNAAHAYKIINSLKELSSKEYTQKISEVRQNRGVDHIVGYVYTRANKGQNKPEISKDVIERLIRRIFS